MKEKWMIVMIRKDDEFGFKENCFIPNEIGFESLGDAKMQRDKYFGDKKDFIIIPYYE